MLATVVGTPTTSRSTGNYIKLSTFRLVTRVEDEHTARLVLTFTATSKSSAPIVRFGLGQLRGRLLRLVDLLVEQRRRCESSSTESTVATNSLFLDVAGANRAFEGRIGRAGSNLVTRSSCNAVLLNYCANEGFRVTRWEGQGDLKLLRK